MFNSFRFLAEQIGPVFLPFILVFAIFFGLLDRMQLFSRKSVNMTLGLAIATLFVSPYYTGVGPNLIPVINVMSVSLGILLVVFLCVILIMGAFNVKLTREVLLSLLAVIIIIDIIIPDIVLLSVLSREFGWDLPPWLEFIQSDFFLYGALALAAGAAVIYFITKEDK